MTAATTEVERDAITAARGERAELAQSHDLLPQDPGEPPASVDARGHEETWNDVLRLQRDGVEPAAFTAITAPVLMVHGDSDPHPGPGTRDLLRRYVPQLEYVELARCGHTPWRERHARDEFFDVLRAWLTDHAAAPGGGRP
jgi:pimeloyl-ACP methyl ester carboxylesterase